MWLCICWGKQFGDTFENPLRRKIVQMQPMWLCICRGKQFGETFEDPLRRKIVQMQPMWLCICSGRQFDETSENSFWWKVSQMQSMWVCICLDWQSPETFESSLRGDSSQPMHYVSIPILPLLPILPLVHLHPSSNTPRLIPFHWSLPLVHIYITLARQHWYYTFCSNFTLTNNTNALEHTLTLAFLHIY